ncbi:MAG: hypothetical protein P1U34_09750 [Coxiellaceae bacterium]|nr:hypothetical protein [Coxiellaceae bacterium]
MSNIQTTISQQHIDELKQQRATLVKDAVDDNLLLPLQQYTHKLIQSPKFWSVDRQVKDSFFRYGDPFFERFLEQMQPLFESLIEEPLYPSYSRLRWYRPGEKLNEHRDRKGCTVVGTTPIIFKAPDIWPLYVKTKKGTLETTLNTGDMAVFYGKEIPHRRDEFTGEYQIQVLLCYVKTHGEDAKYKYDRRDKLNTLSALKQK